MEQSKFVTLLKRAGRTFLAVVAGAFGLAMGAVSLELSKGHNITSVEDIKILGSSLASVFAFTLLTGITASIYAALDKWARWKAPQTPVDVATLPDEL
jgi:hypothetical protein